MQKHRLKSIKNVLGVKGLLLLLALSQAATANVSCPDILQHEMKRLHSSEQIKLCDQFAGRPLLIINTASRCGFTPQFKQLEQLHQDFKDEELQLLGVASNSFKQAAKTEAEAAKVCYVNFGVTFTMLAPVQVKGSKAHPLFRQLASQSRVPTWNFNKYLLNAEGQVIKHFKSQEIPTAAVLTALLNQ